LRLEQQLRGICFASGMWIVPKHTAFKALNLNLAPGFNE